MRAAEAVFAADSAVAIAQLQRPPRIDPVALTALGMLDIAAAFCGGLEQGTQWLASRRLPPGNAVGHAIGHAIARTAATLARNGELSSLGTLPGDLAPSWHQRAQTVAAYRKTLDAKADTTHILDSLLHIHHNRYRGIDRDSEATCRRIARQAALAQHAATTPQTT
jgi:thiopeptide-type bacteriocin biosynthesis protein